eukprot:CAMPEP_0196759460 /NCGR_PEP_ID=MMETSP1091-20130531/104713_1 /TAXON_ID=302021 /ORGANISM="Rhodomonas sp., Strain CCMP768" /LENGTH=260 /DNA_ID=CAMNT_0042108311 /DNA_START=218 /DNA_END=1000 /DNA_ORIENTATION=-
MNASNRHTASDLHSQPASCHTSSSPLPSPLCPPSPAVEALILCRADLTLFDRFGWTALHRAAGGYIGRLLSTWERQVPEKSKGRVRPEDSAAQLRMVAKPRLRGVVAGLKATRRERSEELLDKASIGDANAIQRLVSMNADVNYVDAGRDDVTPLINAASAGSRPAVEALILCRADLTLFDRFGWTALHRAAGLGHVGVVDALVEAGASRKSRDSKGLEPAELAAVAGQDALRTALSSNVADSNVLALLQQLKSPAKAPG